MYKQKVAEKDLEDLYQAMLSLNNDEEFHAFFEDLCTVDELKSLAQRWQVVQMLYEKNKYNDIMKETGASSTTISRVKKCLDYGEGYAMALKRINKKLIDKD
ncbi:MAG: YerC/YecD family TrpR-related protein [Firmicutes bacterium]|nr:YerC/YecD family TrpR-related protein [Bacillota bacterium]